MKDKEEKETTDNTEINDIEKLKVVIVGSLSVGKTCLITRYITGRFLSTIPSTCGTSFSQKKKEIGDKKYILNIWDTAGEEKYGSLTKIFTKNAQIVILVYSIVDRKSFEDLNIWLSMIKETNDDNIVIGLAANKSDLYLSSKVSDSKGRKFANSINAIWAATSALTDDQGIDLLVDELIKKYIEQKQALSQLLENNTYTKSFSLNSIGRDNRKESCCVSKKLKKEKDKKILIQDDNISVSTFDNEKRNSVYSKRFFNESEDNNEIDEEF